MFSRKNEVDGLEVQSFYIKDAYYGEDGNVISTTKDFLYPVGDGSIDDLKKDLNKMLESTDHPVIDEDELESINEIDEAIDNLEIEENRNVDHHLINKLIKGDKNE